MAFYEVKLHYTLQQDTLQEKLALFPDNFLTLSHDDKAACILDLNSTLANDCSLQETLSTFIWRCQRNCFELILRCALPKITIDEGIQQLKKFLTATYAVKDLRFTALKEIPAERFNHLLDRAENKDYLNRWQLIDAALSSNYFDNNQFKVNELMLPEKMPSYITSLKEAKGMMADKAMLDELKRIYAADNAKCYHGNPVHYTLTAGNAAVGIDMARLLLQALWANQRLLSRRVSIISNISDCCYDEGNLKNVFLNAQGGAIIINPAGTSASQGRFASAYEQVIDYFESLIRKYHQRVLFIILESRQQAGFSKALLAKIENTIDLIAIHDGCGNKNAAIGYLRALLKKADFKATRQEAAAALQDKPLYTVDEIYAVYDKWFRTGLKQNYYPSYQSVASYHLTKQATISDPYQALEQMVGLSDIKKKVREILAYSKLQKIRNGLGLNTQTTAKHMLFSGNPGTAKTTVARLLAQLLKVEGVLESGAYVECGREDLVGKFVGWTAPKVAAKFRQASGGILFIDEAYSLVSDDSFGDEAITTIVREMENHRDDVIVIFAGYPDKMQQLLAKNEGLRSRIAFHLDFPDYNPQELLQILQLQMAAKGYTASEQAWQNCLGIFSAVCSMKDFGNGRYVRNFLEQAEIRQAQRVLSENIDHEVTKTDIVAFKPEDFAPTTLPCDTTARRPMGFVS